MATPLFVVLLLVESTDLVFAVDSIPAVLAISQDPLIVYTSNIFAIMGLRSIFFALAGIIQLFHYLQYGLSIILVFVGLKMVLSNIYKIPVGIALGVVAGILAVSVLVSMLWPPKNLDVATSQGGSVGQGRVRILNKRFSNDKLSEHRHSGQAQREPESSPHCR